MLSYIAGETNPDPLVSFAADAALAEVAQLLRRLHDATVAFAPPPGASWRFQVGAPTAGEVVCHNDIAPWNTIVAGRKPAKYGGISAISVARWRHVYSTREGYPASIVTPAIVAFVPASATPSRMPTIPWNRGIERAIAYPHDP
jgi:hypothetical protein